MILKIKRKVIERVKRLRVSKDKKKKWIINVSGVKKEDSGYYM
jgi:hypothetical protein